MKNILVYFYVLAAAGVLTAGMQSCASEDPFISSGEGELRINTNISSDLTRSADTDINYLRESCIIYINSEKGLIRKYKGLDAVPSSITLNTGHYVAEAWAGDSVPASFDKKFYSVYQPFDMNTGQNELNLTCRIANVVVSVNSASLEAGVDDMTIKVASSTGDVVFSDVNIDDKGYFMMPFGESSLTYTIEGSTQTGQHFVKTGEIENVRKGHEYILTLRNEPGESVIGGGYFRVVIEEVPVVEDIIDILGRPTIKGADFNIENQLQVLRGDERDRVVFTSGFNSLSTLRLDLSDNLVEQGFISGSNILACDDATRNAFEAKGISWTISNTRNEETGVKTENVYLTFNRSFFESLPESSKEYMIRFTAVDLQGKDRTASLRIANTEEAFDRAAPIILKKITDLTAVTTASATIPVSVNSEEVESVRIAYRVKGDSEWTEVNVGVPGSSDKARRVNRRLPAGGYSVTLTGLNPSTEYEYKGIADDYESDVMTFTTETPFALVNPSMEDWSTYSAKTLLGTKNVVFPGYGGRDDNPFWESGNEGAATANMVLTDKSTDMKKSGTYSARLESKSAMGMIAAGNIFTGRYVQTDGTNGVLSLGRPYNGSHPTGLRVWTNYRPGNNVSVKSSNEEYLPAGFANGNDHGQIYVALVTEQVEIRTNPNNRKLFNPDGNEVIAYGQVTFEKAFGKDGTLECLEIPLVYKESAKTTKPAYVVIVASASKYGDFFSGSPGSVFYLDDFELIYDGLSVGSLIR